MNLQLYNIELQALKLYDAFWPIIKVNIIDKLSQFIKLKYQTLNEKLQNLTKYSQSKIYKPEQTDFQFHEPIQNLTNVQFSNSELEHIYKGFKSNFHQNAKQQINNMIIDSEYIIQNNSIQNKQELRHQINQEINKNIIKKNIIKQIIKNFHIKLFIQHGIQ